MNDLAAAAKQWSDLGQVALALDGKVPVVGSGWQKLTATPHDAFRKKNVTGVGLLLGRGFVDVDLDGLEPDDDLGDLPPTRMFGRAGEVRHLIYRYEGEARPTRKWKDPTTDEMIVEFRCAGAQTMMPPSLHRETGQRVEWMNDAEIALVDLEQLEQAVDALAQKVLARRRRRAYAQGALTRATAAVRSAGEGARNDTLNREAYSLAGLAEIDDATIERELTRAATDAGLTADEVKATIASGIRAGRAAPRETPARDGKRHPSTPYGDGRRFASAITEPDAWPDVEPPVEWLVPALQLAAGRPALFNGPGSIGKTLVAQYVATCLLGGVSGLGGLVGEGPRRRVVHIDGDQGGAATRARYRRIAAALGVRELPRLVALLRAEGFDPTRVDDWIELLGKHDLAVIDSLSTVLSIANLDENSATDTKRVLAALLAASDEARCAILLMSHSGHDLEDTSGNATQRKRPRGSSAIFQGAGAIWTFTGSTQRGAIRTATLVRESEQGDGGELVTSWRFSIVSRDVTVAAVPGESGLAIERVEGGVDPAAERRAVVVRKIFDTLHVQHHHGARDGVLRAAHAGKLEFARAVFDELVGKGLLVRYEGAWRLKSDVPDAQRPASRPLKGGRRDAARFEGVPQSGTSEGRGGTPGRAAIQGDAAE